MFGIGPTKKLQQRIVELENQAAATAKKIADTTSYNKGQLAIREAENLTLTVRISEKEKSIVNLMNDIENLNVTIQSLELKIITLQGPLKENKISSSNGIRPTKLQEYYDRGKNKNIDTVKK